MKLKWYDLEWGKTDDVYFFNCILQKYCGFVHYFNFQFALIYINFLSYMYLYYMAVF